ncbi:S49 family peptidase [Leptothrix discophora]|uniref:S49 family peptidase n=1 Tax=Leptothrix discophora TaxID=89 RepID=A0ABT9FZZ7_LEPDI|nr:S49 family peptidase [Leptothrix discophora]MDP4299804.1 S49 family peptidase [Leptothrix discophora]
MYPDSPNTPDRGATPSDAAPAPAPVTAAPARSASEALIEQFAQDYLKDRRSARRWNLLIRLGWLAAFAALVWGLLTQNASTSAPSGPHTALVELRGEIAPDTVASAEVMLSGLKSAFEDVGARAVVIRINSPGGSPVQAGIIHDEIRRLKSLHDKQVYVVVEESCASGAYYVAAAADAIYVDKASIVGSIGVLMDGFGFTGLMDKLGVERRLITAGENKGMLDPYSPLSERQRALAQAMIDQIHQQFIDVVRKGRGEKLKETPETFSGLFWNGEEAVKLGLADGLGNLDYVAREVVKAENIIDYTPHENVAERLAKRFGASVGFGAVRALRLESLQLR